MKGLLLVLLILSLIASASLIRTDIDTIEKRFHLSFSEDERKYVRIGRSM